MTNEVAEPALVKPKGKVSIIWLLPLITLMIGAGLVFHAWQNRGIQIQVQFEIAEGLEANKTKVRYRSVDVGKVKRIRFTDDNQSIIASVEINRQMANLLSRDTEFWIVRPRIGSEGISGINTIFSGAYIQLEPGKSKQTRDFFVGLESPPVTSPNTDGVHITLITDTGGDTAVGNPVLYRGYKVGVVESSSFDPISRKVNYGVFIQAPYNSLVTSNTVFWNAGGMSVSTSTNGITVDLPSVESLISGGIEFDVLEQEVLGEAVSSGAEFALFKNKADILEQRKYKFLEFVLLVDDTIDGLSKGAPVEYRGIRIGTVAKPYLDFTQIRQINENEERIPVLLHIEPERMYQGQEFDMDDFAKRVEGWILGGLMAKTEMANILTGSLQISLSPSEEERTEIEYFGQYPIIPSAKSDLENMTRKVDTILDSLAELPLEQTLARLDQTLLGAQTSFDEINRTLQEMQKTLQGVQPDSAMYHSIEESMQELQKTLKSVQPVLSEINKRPNTLIFSGPPTQDVEPKGKNND